MKQLILISAFLVVATAKLFAQDNHVIEIVDLDKGALNNKNNQFKIVAHEELNIDLTFNLKKFEVYEVIVLNKLNEIVYAKTINKEGKNKVYFDMGEEEQYTVKLISEKNTNLVANLNKN